MAEMNGSSKKDEASFDGVVNELRNVLSGLGRPAPVEPTPASAAPAPLNDPLNEMDHRAASPSTERPAANGNATGATSEPLASDADFWNGNVLGWPSGSDTDLPKVPARNNSTSLEPAPSDNNFLREDAGDGGFMTMGDPVMPEPEPLFEPEPVRPAPAPAAANAFLPPIPEAIEKSPDVWPVTRHAEELIPEAPTAPTSEPEPVKPPATPPTADPWLHPSLGLDSPPPEERPAVEPAPARQDFDLSALENPVPPVPAPVPIAAVKPAADFEFELPIPGTKETKDKPPVDSGPQLDLEGTEMKPRDLVHVACIYPEGQEKAGQTFVTKLREAAEKMRAPITVQAVFVSGWAADKVDLPAWGKSASLSGADVMFVLAFRASAKMFQNLSAASANGGPKTRLVMLEQIGFPTLYADILVELRRAR